MDWVDLGGISLADVGYSVHGMAAPIEDDPVISSDVIEDDPVISSDVIEDDPVISSDVIEDDPVISSDVIEDDPVISSDVIGARAQVKLTEDGPVLKSFGLENTEPPGLKECVRREHRARQEQHAFSVSNTKK